MLKKLNTEPVMIMDLHTMYSIDVKIKVKLVRNLEHSICDDDNLKEPSCGEKRQNMEQTAHVAF